MEMIVGWVVLAFLLWMLIEEPGGCLALLCAGLVVWGVASSFGGPAALTLVGVLVLGFVLYSALQDHDFGKQTPDEQLAASDDLPSPHSREHPASREADRDPADPAESSVEPTSPPASFAEWMAATSFRPAAADGTWELETPHVRAVVQEVDLGQIEFKLELRPHTGNADQAGTFVGLVNSMGSWCANGMLGTPVSGGRAEPSDAAAGGSRDEG